MQDRILKPSNLVKNKHYSDINESFYNSMESMYLKALEYMKKEGLLKHFENRALQIVNKTGDIGWGFHDTLGDFFYQFY